METLQSLPLGIQEFLARQSGFWKQAEGTQHSDLLRLNILRDIIRFLHAERSNCLASGRKIDAQMLLQWERGIEDLRLASGFGDDLLQVLSFPAAARKRTRLLPEALFNSIPRDRFERHDRVWETALAAEACALGWCFWALNAWVKVPAVESWNQRLVGHLWPSGILLFVESMGFQESGAGKSATGNFPAGNFNEALWNGRWTLALEPRFATAADLSMNFGQWPGAPGETPHPPQWKLLFSPRKR